MTLGKLAFVLSLICISFSQSSSIRKPNELKRIPGFSMPSKSISEFWSSMFGHVFPKRRIEQPNQNHIINVHRRYDSYDKFNPDQYEKGSVEWNNAMINYLLDMKMHGENMDSGRLTDMGLKEVDGAGDGNVICKMEPYNLCYTLDDQGIMHPIGEHRPVRLLRIY